MPKGNPFPEDERLRRRRESYRLYRINHLEKVKEKERRVNAERWASGKIQVWQAANPQKVVAAQAKVDLRDPPKARTARCRAREKEADPVGYLKRDAEYTARRRAENPNIRLIDLAWRTANRERILTYGAQRRQKTVEIGHLSKGLFALLMQEQGGKCPYCLCEISDKGSPHQDHYMPLYLGGAHTDTNIQLTCRTCNSRKGRKHPMTFFEEVFGSIYQEAA